MRAPSQGSEAEGLAQERVGFRKHLRPLRRVIQLVIEFLKNHQLIRDIGAP